MANELVSKDAVWQELVKRAHATPEPWTTVAAGMMMPGIKYIGGRLGDHYPGDRNDLDSEILEGSRSELTATVADRRGEGHPDIVLADAMLSGVVTPHKLILFLTYFSITRIDTPQQTPRNKPV